MDTTQMDKGWSRDRAIEAAHSAAVEISDTFDEGADDLHFPAFPGSVVSLGTFVRENPSAPAESLFLYAKGQKMVAEGAPGWPELPLGERLAFETFHDVLLNVDRALAGLPKPPPAAPYRPAVHVDDTIFAPSGGPRELLGELLDEVDRPMTIVQGSGELANRQAVRRALPAGTPIGTDGATVKPVEENIVRLGPVDSAAPHAPGDPAHVAEVREVLEDAQAQGAPVSPDRATHGVGPVDEPDGKPAENGIETGRAPDPIAGAPSSPLGMGLAPGGAVGQAEGAAALGHGFDPAAGNMAGAADLPADLQPRNDPTIGGDPGFEPEIGLAPSVGSEIRGGQNRNVPAPGEAGEDVKVDAMTGTDDELGVRNAPVLGGVPAAEPLSPQNLNVPTAGNTQAEASSAVADQVHQAQSTGGQVAEEAEGKTPVDGSVGVQSRADAADQRHSEDAQSADPSAGHDEGGARPPAEAAAGPARDPLADGDDPIDPMTAPKGKKKKSS